MLIRTKIGERERVLTKKSKAFTLVEILIVVVIIGILSAALLPRLQNMLAKSRDTKRVADLRNIAAAIEMYRSEHGKLPHLTFPHNGIINENCTECGWGSVYTKKHIKGLESSLAPYMTSIPKDPKANSVIALHYVPVHKIGGYVHFWGENFQGGTAMMPGTYLYQIFQKGGNLEGVAVVVAKVETAEHANYVLVKNIATLQGGLWGTNYGRAAEEAIGGFPFLGGWGKIEDLHLCTKVEKVERGNEAFQVQSDGSVGCKYSSADQLYYIHKIE